MLPDPAITERITQAVNRQRLLETAKELIAIPSPTGQGGAVADRLAEMLSTDGFTVERPPAGHHAAPAVVVRWNTGKPGRTLQFNGHLDTVHLPFVPPAVQSDHLTGSGSCDMKGGFTAAIEALRVLRETDTLSGGGILLTAHDLHESPWGDNSQLNQLIQEGYVGDAVMLPEYLHDRLAIIGRGGFNWIVTIRRQGSPIHEVLRPADEPNVLAVAAEIIRRLEDLNRELSKKSDEQAGPETVFVGQIHGGEIYNQYPQECRLEGTRRWLPDNQREQVEQHFRAFLNDLAQATGTTITADLRLMRDAFLLDQNDAIVHSFQGAYETTGGTTLPIGAKPFCDDGNTFWALARIPAITHGPRSGGAHTVNEWVSIDDLVRLARVYALTAIGYTVAG